MKKVKTALGDVLEYLDRVEGRGIDQVPVAKFRERIKERLALEKERMIRFAKKTKPSPERDWDTIFDELFEPNKGLEPEEESFYQQGEFRPGRPTE